MSDFIRLNFIKLLFLSCLVSQVRGDDFGREKSDLLYFTKGIDYWSGEEEQGKKN